MNDLMKKFFQWALCAFLVAGAWSCNDDEGDFGPLQINGGAGFLSLDARARSGTISIASLAPWDVEKAAADTWFSLSAPGGPAGRTELELSLDANDGPARSATLIFRSGENRRTFVVSQSASHAGFDAPDYYFYVTFGTMPTLYAGLHLLSHDKPSYVFYERSKTFAASEFPSRAEVTVAADPTDNATDADERRMRTEMKRRIREINAADPTAVFGLYVDDLRCRIGYDWFVAQGIDSARVKVSMLSDGTATYDNFDAYFGDAGRAEQNWNAYASQVEALDWDHGGRYPETRSIGEFESPTWPYYLSTRPNYRLEMQDGSLLESSGQFMDRQLAAMNILSVQPYALLSSLPPSAQQQFYRMASFDYDRFAEMFDASPKRNLIIIGTSHKSSESEQTQRRYVKKIVDRYGEEYDIFFKPHPADKSSADYGKRFGLTLLPGQMPFEIFVWSLIDKIDLIGGYQSTVFLTVPVDKVGFIFAPGAASLIRPLDILFRDAQGIEWMQ